MTRDMTGRTRAFRIVCAAVVSLHLALAARAAGQAGGLNIAIAAGTSVPVSSTRFDGTSPGFLVAGAIRFRITRSWQAGAGAAWGSELAEYAGNEIRRSGPGLGLTAGMARLLVPRDSLHLSTSFLSAALGSSALLGVEDAAPSSVSHYWDLRVGLDVLLRR